jgi:hypothetical protein
MDNARILNTGIIELKKRNLWKTMFISRMICKSRQNEKKSNDFFIM